MTTLFDIVLGVAEKTELPARGVSTGGSSTTLVDANTTTQDGLYNGGTLFVQSGGQASTYHRIKRYLSDGTYTIATVSPALAAGARYSAVTINLNTIISAVNSALRDIGQYLAEDSSLTVVSGQLEYSLPSGVSNIRQVEDITSNLPTIKYRWDEVSGKLRFRKGFAASGSTLRLTYRANHAAVALAADTVLAYIDIPWLISRATVIMLQDLERTSGDKAKWDIQIQREMATEMQIRNPAADMPTFKLARW